MEKSWAVTGGTITAFGGNSNHACSGMVGVIGSPGANTCVFRRRVVPGRTIGSCFTGWQDMVSECRRESFSVTKEASFFIFVQIIV